MGSDLNKKEAIELITNMVKKYTSDFELMLLKRKPKNRIVKTLVFALKVKEADFNEELFDDFMSIEVSGAGVCVIQSELIVEHKTVKDVFLLSVDVNAINL